MCIWAFCAVGNHFYLGSIEKFFLATWFSPPTCSIFAIPVSNHSDLCVFRWFRRRLCPHEDVYGFCVKKLGFGWMPRAISGGPGFESPQTFSFFSFFPLFLLALSDGLGCAKGMGTVSGA